MAQQFPHLQRVHAQRGPAQPAHPAQPVQHLAMPPPVNQQFGVRNPFGDPGQIAQVEQMLEAHRRRMANMAINNDQDNNRHGGKRKTRKTKRKSRKSKKVHRKH